MNETDFGKGNASRPGDPLPGDAGLHTEVSAAPATPDWQEKSPSAFVTYPKKNQGTNDSCMAQSGAKMLSVEKMNESGIYRELSAHSIYPFGFVAGGGMTDPSLTTVLTTKGATLETLFPSYDAQGNPLTEEVMRDPTGLLPDAADIGEVYKAGVPVYCASDLDTIASILESYQKAGKKKVVRVSVVGSNNSTWFSEFPAPPGPNDSLWYHSVVATDFGLINGKKYISIDNSWGLAPGVQGQQFLGEEYQPKMYGAFYILPPGAPTGTKPSYTWNNDLSIGSGGNDVLALQKALQYLGMFPTDEVIKPTGYYGGITVQAVKLFQAAYQITPQSGVVGPLTRAKLNELFTSPSGGT